MQCILIHFNLTITAEKNSYKEEMSKQCGKNKIKFPLEFLQFAKFTHSNFATLM